MEGKGEVDDERQTIGGESNGGALPEGGEKAEKWDARSHLKKMPF